MKLGAQGSTSETMLKGQEQVNFQLPSSEKKPHTKHPNVELKIKHHPISSRYRTRC